MAKAKIWMEVKCGCCGCVTSASRFYRNKNDISTIKKSVENWKYTDDYGNTCPDCLEKIKNRRRKR